MTEFSALLALREKFEGRRIHLISAYVDRHKNPRGIKEFPEPPDEGEYAWAINGWWIHWPHCALGFEMHDFGGPSYEALGDARDWYIENCLRKSEIPIFMPRETQGFPNVLRYPLEEIEAFYGLGRSYFGESPNYCIALAGMWGVKTLVMHGFNYPLGYPKSGERASTEFWLGMASGKTGMQVEVSEDGNILLPDPWEDFYHPLRYGYRDNGE